MLEMNDCLYKKYDTIIFDLDGTLLDTIEDLADSVNFALASEGFSKHTLSEIQSFVGNGSAKLIERAVPDGTSEEIKEKTLACFKRYYADNCENKTKPYEGIYDLLDRLTEKGFKIAVVSNKIDSAVCALCKRYFGTRIQFCLGDREGIKRKPAPDAVFEVIKKLSSTCESSLYVGDSDVDIQTARNAGVDCVSVTWGFRDKNFLIKSGASLMIDKPLELLEILSPVKR